MKLLNKCPKHAQVKMNKYIEQKIIKTCKKRYNNNLAAILIFGSYFNNNYMKRISCSKKEINNYVRISKKLTKEVVNALNQ